MNLQQIKDDLDNEVIVCRATIVKAIEYALELEKKVQEPVGYMYEWIGPNGARSKGERVVRSIGEMATDYSDVWKLIRPVY